HLYFSLHSSSHIIPFPTRRPSGLGPGVSIAAAHLPINRGRAPDTCEGPTPTPAGVGPSHGYDGQRTSVISGPRCSWPMPPAKREDRKSTRLNSSHVKNSYAVFCLK